MLSSDSIPEGIYEVARLRIHEVAAEQGISAAKLSRRADVTYRTVLDLWHNRHRDVTLSTLEKLAAVLQVPVADLIVDGEPSEELQEE